jgi:tetratricopeptide (TPR) repeat protein
VELAPGRAAAWVALSEWLVDEGRPTEALRAARKAREADAFLQLPHDVLHQYYYAVVQEGPVEEARQACDEGRGRFPESSLFLTCQLFLLASFPQVPPRVDRAWVLRDSMVVVSSEARAGDMHAYATLQVAKVAARGDLPDSAVSVYDRALPDSIPKDFLYDAAHFWVLMDRPGTALPLLERYLEVYPAEVESLARDWWFDPLHQRPEFRALVGSDR